MSHVNLLGISARAGPPLSSSSSWRPAGRPPGAEVLALNEAKERIGITSLACCLWASSGHLSFPLCFFQPLLRPPDQALRSSSSSSSGTTNFYGLAHGAGELQCLTLVSLVLERTSPGPCAEPGMRLMILGLPNQNMTLT